MNVLIQSKSVYGVTKFYPMNETAKLLAQVAGTATLTESTLKLAEQMGMCVTEMPVLARV